MGRDKALLEFQGQPLIHQMARLIADATGAPPALLGPASRYETLGYAVIEDPVAEAGPLAGLVAMLASPLSAELNLVLPVDMPGLDPAIARSWLDAARANPGADAVIPVTATGNAPLSAVYRRRCHAALAEALAAGTRRVRTAIARLRIHEMPATPTQLANLNTPEDWSRFEG